MEEVRRIIVVRQMRMALRYNLGYGFFALVSNFKRRKPVNLDDEQAVHDREHPDENDVVPQFDSPEEEDLAVRKELRELFVDSVKGLDFPDLVQDREAFEKMYVESILSRDELARPDHGALSLARTEAMVDEIMYDEEVCLLVGVDFQPSRAAVDAHTADMQHAADVEEKRRHDHHKQEHPEDAIFPHAGRPNVIAASTPPSQQRSASVEPAVAPTPPPPPPPGRRASMERASASPASDAATMTTTTTTTSSPPRRASLEGVPPTLASPQPGRRGSLEPVRRASLEPSPVAPVPVRRASLQGRRPSVEQVDDASPFSTRQASLDDSGVARRRSSLGEAQVDEIEMMIRANEAASAPEQRPRRASLDEPLPEGVVSEAVLERRHSRRGSFPLVFPPPAAAHARFEHRNAVHLAAYALLGALLSFAAAVIRALARTKSSMRGSSGAAAAAGPLALLIPLALLAAAHVYVDAKP